MGKSSAQRIALAYSTVKSSDCNLDPCYTAGYIGLMILERGIKTCLWVEEREFTLKT